MKTFILTALVALLFSGCVKSRTPQPTALRQTGDAQLTCDQITIEYKANSEVGAAKIAKNESSDTRDFWLGVFVWPGLMDLQNADGNEGNALLDRNVYLRELGKNKNCSGMESWPAQPDRYTYKFTSRESA